LKFDFMLNPIFYLAPADSENIAQFQSGQK